MVGNIKALSGFSLSLRKQRFVHLNFLMRPNWVLADCWCCLLIFGRTAIKILFVLTASGQFDFTFMIPCERIDRSRDFPENIPTRLCRISIKLLCRKKFFTAHICCEVSWSSLQETARRWLMAVEVLSVNRLSRIFNYTPHHCECNKPNGNQLEKFRKYFHFLFNATNCWNCSLNQLRAEITIQAVLCLDQPHRKSLIHVACLLNMHRFVIASKWCKCWHCCMIRFPLLQWMNQLQLWGWGNCAFTPGRQTGKSSGWVGGASG